MKKYNNITEILDTITTDKDGVRRTFADIGSADNNYAQFMSRYRFFKKVLQKDYPELSNEEIIKFYKLFHRFGEIYSWNGVHTMFTIFEWENKNVNYETTN